MKSTSFAWGWTFYYQRSAHPNPAWGEQVAGKSAADELESESTLSAFECLDQKCLAKWISPESSSIPMGRYYLGLYAYVLPKRFLSFRQFLEMD